MLRGLTIAVVAAMSGLLILPAGDAMAQSCRAIQNELASLQGGGGSSRRYERAFREQAAVLSRAERQARRAGCAGGGFSFFGSRPQRVCRSLVPKIRQMRANLGRLDRLRQRGGGGRNANSRRVRVLQAMARDRGCGQPRQQEARRQAERREARRETLREPRVPVQRGGTFRTLCVRTCDGYYFPVSFSTTSDQFAQDSQTCQAMCPGATAELYVHRNPGSGPEEMVSVAGAPYSELPTAFQYRTSYDPSCTCKTKAGEAYALIQTPPRTEAPSGRPPSLPVTRPPPGDDPETVANLAGDFVPRFISRSSGMQTSDASSHNRAVRVVGPVYWGAREKEGVVLTPVPN